MVRRPVTGCKFSFSEVVRDVGTTLVDGVSTEERTSTDAFLGFVEESEGSSLKTVKLRVTAMAVFGVVREKK